MPRILTKKKSEKYAAKQDKLIKLRLMEISLKVDDYVYKNKSISDSTAKLYIQEVTSYKAMCSKDPRSIQVIEKLIRCMKGIITERKADNCQDNIERDKETRNNTPSPVYSVTDEDKMHISQNVLGNNFNEESKILEEVETIDLCSDDDDIGRNNDDEIQDNLANIDVHFEKALSNLSMQDIDEIQTKVDNNDFAQLSLHYPEQSMISNLTTAPNYINANNETTDISGIYIDCSQSLLGNYNDKNLNKDEVVPDQNVKALLTANLKKYIAEVMSNYKSIVNHSNKNNNENNNMNNVKLTTNTSGMKIHGIQTEIPVTIRNITKTCIDKITPQLDIKTAINTSSSTIITTNNKDSKKPRVFDQIKKSVPKKKRTQKKKAETNKSKDSNFKENIKTNKPSKKCAKVKDITTNQETNRNDFANDSIPKIYTRHVEEDLSWVEDIRYVREHTKDHDENLMNIEESFWDNYSLPAIWDDQDFLYTV